MMPGSWPLGRCASRMSASQRIASTWIRWVTASLSRCGAHQGARSLEIWTGATVPVPVMQAAAKAGARVVLAVLFMVSILNFIDRQIVSILAVDIKADLGLTESGCDALLGHRKGTIGARYTHRTIESLRPYVEEWAGLVLGESGAKRGRLEA